MTQSDRINRQWILAERPVGEPDDSTLRLIETPVPTPGKGQMLLRFDATLISMLVDCFYGGIGNRPMAERGLLPA